jgi:hypothetical protein
MTQVGEKYFNKYITYSEKNSGFRQPRLKHEEASTPCENYLWGSHYYFVYNLHISQEETIFASIEFITDTLGNIISDCYIDRIPECPDNDCYDFFPVIKKDNAILIAKNNGFEEGKKDWIISFHHYSEDFNGYVWDLKNTLFEGGTYVGQGASGKGILISALDGSVILNYGWAAIH